MNEPFQAGDRVRITCAGQTIEGDVALASNNGRSLMLTFNGVLGKKHAYAMPVLDLDDAGFRSILTDEPVTITKREDTTHDQA